MLIENLSYLSTFIITTGIAVIGVLGTYTLFQTTKKQVLQILLYQQIFLFSFFLYGIWGNIAIHEIISDLNLNNELSRKLSLFVPVLGTPFLIVSWFMFLRFVFGLWGYSVNAVFMYIYFIAFFIVIVAFGFSVQNQIIDIPVQPDLFVVRTLIVINLFIHFVTLLPFLKPAHQSIKNRKLLINIFLIYSAGVLVYSGLLFYINYFGFWYTCISLILLFTISIVFPVAFRIKAGLLFSAAAKQNIGFKEFCELYEISKREAEIILEICSGKTNKAIADKLFITLQTVKDHNHRIYTKTQVKSRVQLANLVREKTGIKEF